MDLLNKRLVILDKLFKLDESNQPQPQTINNLDSYVDSIVSNTVKADQDALLNASLHIITNLTQSFINEESRSSELKQITKLQQCLNCFSNNYQLDKKYLNKHDSRNASDKILTELTTVPVSAAIARLVTASAIINPRHDQQLPHIADDNLRISTISNSDSHQELISSYINSNFPSIDNNNEDEIITHAEGTFEDPIFEIGTTESKKNEDEENEGDEDDEDDEDDIYAHEQDSEDNEKNNDLRRSSSNSTLITTSNNDNDEVIDHIHNFDDLDLKRASIKELSSDDNETESCHATEDAIEKPLANDNSESDNTDNNNVNESNNTITIKRKTCETIVNNKEAIESTVYLNDENVQTITLPPLKKAIIVVNNNNNNSSDDEDEVTNYDIDPLSSVSHI